MANDGFNLFGFQIKRAKTKENWSVVPPVSDDGAVIGNSNAAYYGLVIDLEGIVKNENDLIRRYREISNYGDCDAAIEDIVNEAIVADSDKVVISIKLDELQLPDKIKDIIHAEFDNILRLLDFEEKCHDIFRQWYIDGRLFYNIILDPQNPKNGIVELRYVDPRKIRKIKNVKKDRDPKSGADIITSVEEYYLFNDKGITEQTSQGIKISMDSILYCHSGLIDYNTGMALSYLHSAIKPCNQLKVMEDATVIYRISRAPERRVFYIDVGNLPKLKAEQYVQEQMNKYRNKIVFDASTGEVRDNRQHLSLQEDFWMPRRDCLALDTKIKLLDNRTETLQQLIQEYEEGKENWTYSVSPEGDVVPGLITWAGITRRNTQVVDVTLDNGEVVTTTPDHKFILRNGEKVEAQHLLPGQSLMPLNTEYRVMYGNSDYEYVQNNKDNKWKTTHKMVVESLGQTVSTSDVVHHIDFNRFNNHPSNLAVMNKQDHFDYHSNVGSKTKNENWRMALSEAGKRFFETEDGIKRRQEISSNNKINPAIINGAAKGRSVVKAKRALDKQNMSHEEYLRKWSPGIEKFSTVGRQNSHQQRKHDKKTMSHEEYVAKWNKLQTLRTSQILEQYKSYDINLIISQIREVFTPNIKNDHIVQHLQKTYEKITIHKLRNVVKFYGYDSLSDFIVRNFDNVGQRRSYKAPVVKNNHKVVSVKFRDDLIDTGTISIDEDHIHHDYHNFALGAGIFVMNSGKSTEITTLMGAQNLAQIEDVNYFQMKLYQSLRVPISRLQPQQGFSLGRSTEITREEVKFNKFIERLRRRFSALFRDALRVQLITKGIIRPEEWDGMAPFIRFDYQRDNHFAELKNAEILMQRIQLLQQVDSYVGKYFSMQWIKENVLMQTEEDMKIINAQMQAEQPMILQQTAAMQQAQQGEAPE